MLSIFPARSIGNFTDREGDRHLRPLPQLGADADLPLVVVHDPADDGQSQAAPSLETGIKRLEEVFLILVGHPLSRIREPEFDLVLPRRGEIDGQNAPVRHGPDGVFNDVPEDLFELGLAAVIAKLRSQEIALDLDPPVELPAGPEDLQRLVEDVRKGDHGKNLLRRKGEIQELTETVGDPDRLLESDLHELPLFRVEGQVLLQDLDGSRDGRQRVSDLVSQRRRDPSRLRQPLADEKLLLGFVQGLAGPAEPAGQRIRQEGDEEKGAPGDEDHVEDGAQLQFDVPSHDRPRDHAEIHAVHQAPEKDGRQARRQVRGPAGEDEGSAHDRKNIQEVGRASDPPRGVNEHGDEKEIARELDVGLGSQMAPPVIDKKVNGRQGVGRQDDLHEIDEREAEGRRILDDQGQEQKEGHDEASEDDHPEDALLFDLFFHRGHGPFIPLFRIRIRPLSAASSPA
jgi:hypothetical protein